MRSPVGRARPPWAEALRWRPAAAGGLPCSARPTRESGGPEAWPDRATSRRCRSRTTFAARVVTRRPEAVQNDPAGAGLLAAIAPGLARRSPHTHVAIARSMTFPVVVRAGGTRTGTRP